MIDQLINYSVYGLVFTLCTTSYTFFNLFNKSTFYFIKKRKQIGRGLANKLFDVVVCWCLYILLKWKDFRKIG